MQSAALSQFRSAVPACELAVYVDIGAGTVLAADGALNYPQEYLDALCTCAAVVFQIAPDDAAGPFDHAFFATPTGVRAFVRAEGRATDVLCCICAPGVEAADLLAAARCSLGDLQTDAPLAGARTTAKEARG